MDPENFHEFRNQAKMDFENFQQNTTVDKKEMTNWHRMGKNNFLELEVLNLDPHSFCLQYKYQNT